MQSSHDDLAVRFRSNKGAKRGNAVFNVLCVFELSGAGAFLLQYDTK
ncbi:MAG: hypothetical protein PHS86_05820 [Syntrophaceae bacterium]|nr:hypothetical protein [Syntrophaceae bacterium]